MEVIGYIPHYDQARGDLLSGGPLGNPRTGGGLCVTAPELSEQEWQTQVVDLAHLYRWLVHSVPNPREFVNLIMVRSGRALFVVLPGVRGLLTADQMAWRDRLLLAGQDWRCWRPKHWPEVQATLAPSPWSNLRLTEDVNVQGRVL